MYKHIYFLFFLITAAINGYTLDSGDFSKTPGIVLSFDDTFYGINEKTWTQHFELFDKYDAKVTFFVNGRTVTNFMLNAQNHGHEIGFHTITHQRLPELTQQRFFWETISPIGIFRNAGIELTTFAYPYGLYREWMNDELLKYYKIVRGYTEKYTDDFKLYSGNEMKSGFIDALSIDKHYLWTDRHFQNTIDQIFSRAIKERKIVAITSHSINNSSWGITPERLEYVLKKGQEYGLKFYRFKDFQ